MRKEFLIAMALGLSAAVALPVDAQQRSSSSRRTLTGQTAVANSNSGTAVQESSDTPGAPQMGGRGMGGAPGPGRQNQNPNAFRAAQIIMFQNEAQTAALSEDGKLDIAQFRSEFVRLLKEADTNMDGVLNEDELQALSQKMMENMRERFQNDGRQRGPGFGRGGDLFNEFRNDRGLIDISKVDDSPMPDQFKEQIKQRMTAADSNGDGFLDDEELRALQENTMERMWNGGPGMDRPGKGGPGMGGQGGNESNDSQRGFGRRNSFSYAPEDATYALDETAVVRAQEVQDNVSRAGNRSQRFPGGQDGPGMGGQNGPGQGVPGMGRPGMGGFGGGAFMGGFGRGGSNVVQKAAINAMNDDGELNIAEFDKELGKLLSDADNEDDGVLDALEQIDAFGRPLVQVDGRGPQGDVQQGGRRGPQTGGQPGRQVGQGRGGAEIDELMRARLLPTPDPDLFVAVPANESFKFAKPFAKSGTAEKVAIERDYAIGKYEVRNREYKEFVDATNRVALPTSWVDGTYPKGMKNCPVVDVTVKDAEDYCEWLSQKYEGWTFRLPTEAEFENAAAGPQKLLFPWGRTSEFSYSKGELTAECQYNAMVVADFIKDDATITVGDTDAEVAKIVTISNRGVLTKGWRDSTTKTGFTYSKEFAEKSKTGGYVAPVYKFQNNRSPYGCVGMAGNAAEWTSTVVDGKNVVRGGSWYSSAEECSATYRGESQDPTRRTPIVGFRVVAEQI